MFEVDSAQIDDLNSRLRSTRWPRSWPGGETDAWRSGSPQREVRRLAEAWQRDFDWRTVERELNALPWGVEEISGSPVAYLHFRARASDAMPIVLTNGWPSSFFELLTLARLLTRPAPGSAAPAFHVVVPCLPGFPGSPQAPDFPPSTPTHELWHRLMTEHLGYDRYGAHGGDLGAGVTSLLGQEHAEHVVGIHLTSIAEPAYDPETLTAEERTYLDQAAAWFSSEGAYEHQQMTRPSTLGFGLSDSPAGLLAWIVEKYFAWSDNDGSLASVFDDQHVLTQASLYWYYNCIATSFRPYYEFAQGYSARVSRVGTPTALAVFPRDLTRPPRSWAERTYNVQRYSTMPRGGHFAAHEVPELLATDLRDFFAGLR